jgi:hypothetical protein
MAKENEHEGTPGEKRGESHTTLRGELMAHSRPCRRPSEASEV